MMVHLVALASSSTSLRIGVSSKIVEALDNSIRDDLQRSSHGFFLWVLFSAFVVVIGVALEGPEIIHEMWPRFFSWFTWPSAERLHKFERAVKRIGLVGWLMVVVGVMGEGIFEGLQNRVEGQLQTFNNILLKDARLTSSAAKQSALDAAGASARAQASADKADVDAIEAEKKVGVVASKADNLGTQLKAAEAQLKTDEAQRAELEKSLMPRTFSIVGNGQLPNLDKLSQFKGTKFVVRFLPDAEAERAASNLIGVLTSSSVGWKLSGTIPDPTKYTEFFDGVLVTWSSSKEEYDNLPGPDKGAERMEKLRELVRETSKAQDISEELVDFLLKNGWRARSTASGADEEHFPPGAVVIIVGFKPSPYFDPEWIKDMNETNKKTHKRLLDEQHQWEKKFSPQR